MGAEKSVWKECVLMNGNYISVFHVSVLIPLAVQVVNCLIVGASPVRGQSIVGNSSIFMLARCPSGRERTFSLGLTIDPKRIVALARSLLRSARWISSFALRATADKTADKRGPCQQKSSEVSG